MNSKAHLRTVEAMIAVVITFLFLMFVVPTHSIVASDDPDIDLMVVLETSPDFRNCVIAEDYDCIYSSVNRFYPHLNKTYSYVINVSSDPNALVDIPQKNVYVDSVFISGNESYTHPKIVKMYLWVE